MLNNLNVITYQDESVYVFNLELFQLSYRSRYLRLKNVEFMNADKMHFLEKYVSMNNFYNG